MKKFKMLTWTVLALLTCGNIRSDAGTAVDPRLKAFATQKRQQTEALAATLHLAVPPEARDFFKAAEAGDWGAVSNSSERIWCRTGQGESSTVALAFTNVLLEPIRETLDAYEQFQVWDPAMLQKFADGILRSIPNGSIYFGGTLPGEHIIKAVRDVAKSPDVFVITQNGMQDILYLDYLRLSYVGRIWVPSERDIQQAFHQSAQSGGWLTAIHNALSKMIFENNKAQHEFFVEQGVVIAWMYPYLEPHGLILKLDRAPLAQLDRGVITRDRLFWEGLKKELLADPRFLRNEPAREVYAHLRSAIADLYAYRGLTNEAEAVFKQAVELGPKTLMPAFRLAQLYKDAGRYDEAVAVLEQLQSRLDATNPWWRNASDAIEQTRKMKRHVDENQHEPGAPKQLN